ncbi:MAG: PH domain-containing protein [Bacteroidota bacterium]
MKTINLAALQQPQRQSPVAILVILQRLFRTLIRSAWPLLVVYFINPEKTFESYLALIAIGVVLISSISSLITYFNFYFYLNDEELMIQKGWFNKTNRNIPFDRIQTVNFTQSIIHQFFNVVSLEIDTAGSKGNEFSIKALRREKAEAIRSFILSRKEIVASEQADEQSDEMATTSPVVADTVEEELLQLSVLDLLKIGFSQNHLRTIGIIIAFLFGLSDYIEELLGKDIYKEVTAFLNSNVQTIFILLFVFLIISLLLTLVRTVLQYFNFILLKTEQGFKIKSGLLTRNEQSAQIQKIQLIQWSTNPIKRLFGLFSLYLRQAASTAVVRKQLIYIPGCYQEQVQTVRQTYFPEEADLHFTSHQISPYIIGRRVLYYGLLPSLGLMLLSLDSGWLSLGWLPLIPVVYVYNWYYHRKWFYELSDQGLRTQKGLIGQDAVLLQWYKVQSVSIQQSIYQRRKSLADIHFYTAGGSVVIPFVELSKAQALMNFVLYRIEIDQRKWM